MTFFPIKYLVQRSFRIPCSDLRHPKKIPGRTSTTHNRGQRAHRQRDIRRSLGFGHPVFPARRKINLPDAAVPGQHLIFYIQSKRSISFASAKSQRLRHVDDTHHTVIKSLTGDLCTFREKRIRPDAFRHLKTDFFIVCGKTGFHKGKQPQISFCIQRQKTVFQAKGSRAVKHIPVCLLCDQKALRFPVPVSPERRNDLLSADR